MRRFPILSVPAMCLGFFVALALNVPLPSSFPIPWRAQRGWPFVWRHVCDVCASDGGYVSVGNLMLNIVIGAGGILVAGLAVGITLRSLKGTRSPKPGAATAQQSHAKATSETAPSAASEASDA